MGCLLTLSDPLSQGQVQIKIQLQIQLEVQIHSKIQIRDNEVFFYPMSTAFLEAKYKYLLLTEVAGLARLQWIRTIQDFSNLYRFQMLNSRSYESWFVWRMANRSDEQVWISVTLQHLNKLWWTGITLTSKLKNTGPLVIDFVLVKAFKTRKYIENSRMTKQYERQWRAPVKPGESKRYSTHQNIHEENKKSVLFSFASIKS